jgi:hypothetical protein
MSSPTGGGDFLHELEVEVEAELRAVESSRQDEVIGLPVAEWLFDPMDAQQEEVGLRSLLGAVEAMEDDHPRSDGRAAGR